MRYTWVIVGDLPYLEVAGIYGILWIGPLALPKLFMRMSGVST